MSSHSSDKFKLNMQKISFTLRSQEKNGSINQTHTDNQETKPTTENCFATEAPILDNQPKKSDKGTQVDISILRREIGLHSDCGLIFQKLS